MPAKVGQAFSRLLGGLSLAPGSMLLRLRRASIGLLALVCAVGFGLIAFIAQLGWPGVFSGPLPDGPTRSGSVQGTIALTQPGLFPPASARQGVASARQQRGAAPSPPRPDGEARLGGAQELTGLPAVRPSPQADPPAVPPPPQPSGDRDPFASTPVSSAPQTTTPEGSIAQGSAGQSKQSESTSQSKSKKGDVSGEKAKGDKGRNANTASSKHGGSSAKSKGSSQSRSEVSGVVADKAKEDTTTVAVPSAPPPSPAGKDAEAKDPPPSSPAAKDLVDAKDSGK